MKSKRYRFYKAYNGRLFIYLPELEGSKNDLETACGADDMLDFVSKRKNVVWLKMSVRKFRDCTVSDFMDYSPDELYGAN